MKCIHWGGRLSLRVLIGREMLVRSCNADSPNCCSLILRAFQKSIALDRFSSSCSLQVRLFDILNDPLFCFETVLYSCLVQSMGGYSSMCYVEVPAARICAVWVDNNTRHVCTPSIPAGLKCPSPIYDHLTITRLEVN